jgi:hypothetical protein
MPSKVDFPNKNLPVFPSWSTQDLAGAEYADIEDVRKNEFTE